VDPTSNSGWAFVLSWVMAFFFLIFTAFYLLWIFCYF